MPATYTYDPEDPGGTPRNEVRTLIGDTGADGKWALSNQEIDYYLGFFGDDVCTAAVFLIRQKGSELARVGAISRSIGSMSISGGDGGASYIMQVADRLEDWCIAQKNAPSDIPYGEEMFSSDGTIFRVGMHDADEYPGSRAAEQRVDWESGIP